jgi:predicted PurR-regulated permease PerM
MTQDRMVRTSLLLSTLVLVFAALHFASAILAPTVSALFVIAVVWPLQSALQARMPTLLATVITLFVTVAVIGVLVYLLIWGFSLVFQWLLSNTARFQSLYMQAMDWLGDHGIAVKNFMTENYNPGWIMGPARDVAGRSYRLTSFVVIVFAFVALGLLEVDVVRRNIQKLGNDEFQQSLLRAGRNIAVKFQRYMIVRSVMSVLTGLIVWCFALVAGIELATAWGVIAFVFNYIPFLGPLFATIFPTIFALAQSGSWELAIGIFAFLNVVQFITGSYIEPRIAGATLSISPFVVLFAVFFWSFLWGIPGAFIGVPIMIAIIAICNEYETTRWFAVLLSGRDSSTA